MAKVKQKVESKVEEKSTGKTAEVTKRATKVRAAIKKVIESTNVHQLTLAELLAEAYNKRYHEDWGFTDFKVYCEEELDTHWRKAYYFVDIWNKVEEFNLDHGEVKEIGWTKMKEIASIMTKKNYKSLMSKAAEVSSRELGLMVKKIREKTGTGKTSRTVATKMILTMNEDEATAIMEALKEAKKLIESDNDTVAFVMICSDWLEDKGAVPEATPLEAKIEFLEKAYGVKLEVVGGEQKVVEDSGSETKEKAPVAEKKKDAGTSKPKKSAARSKPKVEAKTEKKESGIAGAGDQDIDDLLGL